MQILLHKRSLYSFAFILMNLLLSGTAFGQKITWDRDANTDNWSDPNNWSGNVLPNLNSDVYIPAGYIVNVTGNTTVNSITFSSTNANSRTLTVTNGVTLNVTTSIKIESDPNKSTSATIAGEGNLNCNSIIVGTQVNPTQQLTTSLTTSISFLNNSGNFYINGSYKNGSAYNSAFFTISSGVMTVGGTVYFDPGVNKDNIKGDATLSLISGVPAATLNLTGPTPFLGDGHLIANGINTTVNYSGAGVQEIKAGIYNNLILSGSGEKSMLVQSPAQSFNILGNLTIGGNTSLNANNNTINIGGNWINDGTFNASTSTVIFNGSSSQEIKGTATTTFNNLTINNSSNIINSTGVLLSQGVNVNGSLNLVSGQVTTSVNNVLTLNANASVIGGSNASYVDGPMTKVGDDAFTFPLGGNGKYGPLTISAPGNVADVFTAEYFPTSAAALGTINSQNLISVSGCEYWDLSGTSSINVTLYWNTNSSCNGQYITDPSTVVVAHFDDFSNTWNSHGGTVDITNGSVTWRDVTDFSFFTYGLASIEGVLPVHFSNVRASEKSSGVQVEFTNATESDVAYYEVERSSDGKLFSPIKKLNPLKNNYGSVAYSWVDATAREGRNIYRIKAVETGGKTVYSSLVSITLGAKNSSLSVYAKGGQVALQVSSLPAGKYQLQLFNAGGQLLGIETLNHAGGSISQTTSFNSAKAGIYILNISGAVRMQQKFLVQ